MEKVCLDCAGVYGSHVRPSRKLHFFKILPLIFWCFSQGTFFMHFLGAAAAKASKMAPKRVTLLKHLGGGQSNTDHCYFAPRQSFQALRHLFQDPCQKVRKLRNIPKNCSFMGGPMCDPYTPAQSKHTFCMSTFLIKKRLKTTEKRGGPPPDPPDSPP